ncbi:MAG: peptidase S51 [Flavobacteriales bacterium]|nr:MAG: peptidase S51 [Flavobacteriales bacterium]
MNRKFIPLLILIAIASSGCKRTVEETDHLLLNLQKVETKGPENGTLLIIGGAASDMFYEKFMELVGGPEAPIVVIPTAISSDTLDEEFLAEFKKGFLDKGFTNVTVLHTRNPEEANSEDFILPIKNAIGVWFSGGRQWRHADSYLNTKSHEAFNELLERGGVIAGSSAGATIQGSYLARGDTKTHTIMMGDHELGLGFLSNVAIDQHVLTRNRQFDMFEILDNRPELLGIGIEENTGIIVRGNRFQVVGASYVAIYDGTRWSEERDTIYQLPLNSREFYVINAGREYDLVKRRVITFKNREFIILTEKQLNSISGTYQIKDGLYTVDMIIENDSVKVLQSWDEDKYPILPESSNRFFMYNSEFSFEFESDNNGDVILFSVPSEGSIWVKVHD